MACVGPGEADGQRQSIDGDFVLQGDLRVQASITNHFRYRTEFSLMIASKYYLIRSARQLGGKNIPFVWLDTSMPHESCLKCPQAANNLRGAPRLEVCRVASLLEDIMIELSIPNNTVLSFCEAEQELLLLPITKWIQDFLCQPHEGLGREGEVCPFTRMAISKKSIQFNLNHSDNEVDFIKAIEFHMLDFNANRKNNDIYMCRLIVPIRLSILSAAVVENAQRILKPKFVERHLMVGQFFPDCQERGLWNTEFRPLRSPIPLVAIRHMVPTDVAFLYDDEHFMRTYRTHFGMRAERAIRQYEATRGTIA